MGAFTWGTSEETFRPNTDKRRHSLNTLNIKVMNNTHVLKSVKRILTFTTKDGMECLANSQKDIAIAKREMEELIEHERKVIERYESEKRKRKECTNDEEDNDDGGE